MAMGLIKTGVVHNMGMCMYIYIYIYRSGSMQSM